jgi:hypothetical protein
MKVIDPGHIYECDQLGGGTQIITFVKRSSGAVTYKEEWAGLQSQEILRALIDRTKFLNEILPCSETIEALYHLRMSLYWYEVRAYRRKMDVVNKTKYAHTDKDKDYQKGEHPSDIPFTEAGIENYKVGPDGHITI